MVKTKEAPKVDKLDVIKLVLSSKFQDALAEAIRTHPSDIVRTPLLNIQGDLSHLKDALGQPQSWAV